MFYANNIANLCVKKAVFSFLHALLPLSANIWMQTPANSMQVLYFMLAAFSASSEEIGKKFFSIIPNVQNHAVILCANK
jgi:hypothetical protein